MTTSEYTAFVAQPDDRPAVEQLVEAQLELSRATSQYHAAIDVTEETKRVGNYAWYQSARANEHEMALRYAAAVRAERIATRLHRAATR